MKKITLLFVLLFSTFMLFAKEQKYTVDEYETMLNQQDYENLIIKIQEKNEEAYSVSDNFYLGLSNYLLSNNEEAQHYFKLAFEMDPDFYDAGSYLAYSYLLDGKNEEARYWYEQLIKLDSKNPVAYSMLVYIYEDLGNLEAAYEYSYKYYQLVKDSNSLSQLSYVLFEMKKYDEAKTYIKKYLKKEPDSYTMTSFMIYILTMSGDYKQAEKYKKQLRNIWKNSADPEILKEKYFQIYDFEYEGLNLYIFEKIDMSGEYYYPLTCYVYKDENPIKSINIEYDFITKDFGTPYFLGVNEFDTKVHSTIQGFSKCPSLEEFIEYIKLVLDENVESVASSQPVDIQE